MKFMHFKVLYWIPLVMILLSLLWSFFQKRNLKKLYLFAEKNVWPALLANAGSNATLESLKSRRKVKFFFFLLAITMALLALARPQLGNRYENLKTEGLDVVFLLDVSNSMLAEDVVPNRLKKAKHIIKNFTDKLSGDRAGIVAFAGSAFPAVPLTTDYDFINQTLEVIDQSSISNQGSDLATAINVAVGMLDRGGVNQENADGARVVVVLSDGEETQKSDATMFERVKDANVKVFSIGIGSLKGSTIAMRDMYGNLTGYKKDRSGNMVLSKLVSDKLEELAQKSGGKFYSASSNEGEVEEIISELKSLERGQGGLKRVLVYDEYFQLPLAIALFFLMFSLFYPDRIKAANALVLFFLVFFTLPLKQIHAQERQTSNLREYNETKRGVSDYQKKDFSGAIDHFSKAQAANPDQDEHHINLGDAYLGANDTSAATKEFEQATKSKNPSVSAKGFYNMGKAYLAAKDHEKAIQSFQSGLEKSLTFEKPDPEMTQKFKRALESAQNQKNNKNEEQQKDQDQNKDDQKKNQEGQNKDDKNSKGKDDRPPPNNPKEKPQFKAEKLTEQDAKKIIQQLQEKEKKTQQRMMQKKTEKKESEENGNDW